ncbi:uncharacterized protein VTP21DRAFT_7274 [Calcarisporiella thermophila]|uniref:uncharacterized protein n=1 Tax=Calcarisporiella thermophila TaxID=911321 RepID=UPI0037436F80
MFSHLILFSLALLALSTAVLAHMEVAYPPPRRSKYSNYYKSIGQIDYDMKSPLNPDQWPFPCRNFPEGPAETTLKAGSNIQVQIVGTATHNGGHCQFALQYPGSDFVVFHTIMEECPLSKNYTVPIPASAPAGKATFAWTWVNALGNREYYMNCADVNIDGPTKSCMKGKELAVANYPGYPTIPEFHKDPTHGRKYFDQRKDTQVCNSKSATNQIKGKSTKKPKKAPISPGTSPKTTNSVKPNNSKKLSPTAIRGFGGQGHRHN